MKGLNLISIFLLFSKVGLIIYFLIGYEHENLLSVFLRDLKLAPPQMIRNWAHYFLINYLSNLNSLSSLSMHFNYVLSMTKIKHLKKVLNLSHDLFHAIFYQNPLWILHAIFHFHLFENFIHFRGHWLFGIHKSLRGVQQSYREGLGSRQLMHLSRLFVEINLHRNFQNLVNILILVYKN